jgi:pilus assembly protein CpaB
MTIKTALTLTAAIGLGIVTTTVGHHLVMAARTRPATPELARVVIADRSMDPGYQLTAQDLSVFDMPRDAAPESRFGSPDDLVGRTLVAPVVKGQAMFEDLLAAPGVPSGLEALVPKGMRAVSIEVSESSGMVGLIRPGSHVDVIATIRKGDQSIARTIVENVKVSAVGRKLSRDGKEDTTNPTRTVTLVVSPRHAEAIELAGAEGRPRLALRGPQDTSPSGSSGVTQAELRGEGALASADRVEPKPAATIPPAPVAVAPVAPPGQRRGVQIIRGGKESMIYYDVVAASGGGGSK